MKFETTWGFKSPKNSSRVKPTPLRKSCLKDMKTREYLNWYKLYSVQGATRRCITILNVPYNCGDLCPTVYLRKKLYILFQKHSKVECYLKLPFDKLNWQGELTNEKGRTLVESVTDSRKSRQLRCNCLFCSFWFFCSNSPDSTVNVVKDSIQ